jgi:hypothetical protein
MGVDWKGPDGRHAVRPSLQAKLKISVQLAHLHAGEQARQVTAAMGGRRLSNVAALRRMEDSRRCDIDGKSLLLEVLCWSNTDRACHIPGR